LCCPVFECVAECVAACVGVFVTSCVAVCVAPRVLQFVLHLNAFPEELLYHDENSLCCELQCVL